ncbi:hypothetical protein Ancab_016761 [Ancistrocladus abbreviatus]
MESSPFQCPNSVSIRRNPHRKARPMPTPSTNALPPPASSSSTSHSSELQGMPNFPIEDILSIQVDKNSSNSSNNFQAESLEVFLRLRPVSINQASQRSSRGLAGLRSSTVKNAWPKSNSCNDSAKPRLGLKSKNNSCIVVNDPHSVTILPPSDSNRLKSEFYNGFSHVFSTGSSQDEVYDKMVHPIVKDFTNGRSGLLAALGPSGSGKTYTVFGSPRDPGMVPRALRHLFASSAENHLKRSFYLSMFEIYCEKGKTEKLYDLSPDGGEILMQQSSVKGLKEVLITDAWQAESLIARGMLKRATAMTNTNSQSSRSQCIINIRNAANETDTESDNQLNGAVLTFVDLAGAEREKKTGSQSLLEHQKNPKKPLQKHFLSSLILTVRSGEKDYLDTSFLLRQASPYMEIKFHNIEEKSSLPPNKRRCQVVLGAEQPKRVKLSGLNACTDEEKKIADSDDICKQVEVISHKLEKAEAREVAIQSPNNLAPGIMASTSSEANCTDTKRERDYLIMQGFAKAIWKVLKEYKEKLTVIEEKVQMLNGSLQNERTRYTELEREFNDLKCRCSCDKVVPVDSTCVKAEICSDSQIIGDVNSPISMKRESIISVEGYEPNVGLEQDINGDFNSIKQFAYIPENSENNALMESSPQAADLQSHQNDNFGQPSCECLHGEHQSFPGDVEGEDLFEVKGPMFSDPGLSSSQSHDVVQSGHCGSTNEDEVYGENDKENIASAQLSNLIAVETEQQCVPPSIPLNPERPRRRLMPASSLLLRDINSLDFKDENEKPMGARVGRRLAEDENKRTTGSISLLHLLKSSVYR